METGAVARKRTFWQELRPQALATNSVLLAAVVFLILFMIWTYYLPGGLNAFQIKDLLNLAQALAFASFGATLVLIVGGFDLSVAGLISLVNVLVATQMPSSAGLAFSFAVLLVALGLVVGLINGCLVSFLRLESIATTLATFIILSGLALVLLAAPGGTVPPSFYEPVTGIIGGTIPVALVVLVLLVIIWLVIKRTRFGVNLFAIGADEDAATMNGVRTRAVKVWAFGVAGAMYALAGLSLSAATSTGNPNAGTPFLLTTFAAVALGGTSFAGGKGSAIGSIIGALVLAIIPKVLFVLGIASFSTGLFQGLVMIAAVLLGVATAKLGRKEES